jgi:hypothetical protein
MLYTGCFWNRRPYFVPYQRSETMRGRSCLPYTWLFEDQVQNTQIFKDKTCTKQLKEWISLAGLENFRFVWRSYTTARFTKTSVNLYQSTSRYFPEESNFESWWCNTLIEKVALRFIRVSQCENSCAIEPGTIGFSSDSIESSWKRKYSRRHKHTLANT